MMIGNQVSVQEMGFKALLKSRRFWVGIIISLVLPFLFLYKVDFGGLGRALVGANYIFIIPF